MTRKKTGKALVAGGIPRVNLLPPQVVENRAHRALWRRWMRVFYAAVLVVALEAGLGATATYWLNSQLAMEAAVSEQLQTQLATYSEVIDLKSQVRDLEDLRAQAGSNDQGWRQLIDEVKSVLPDGVVLIGFRLVPGAAPVPGTDASTQVGLKGTFTFSAKATSAQADTVTRLRTVSTFVDVDAGELSAAGSADGFTFVATFSADQTRYTGRFEQGGGK